MVQLIENKENRNTLIKLFEEEWMKNIDNFFRELLDRRKITVDF